MSAPDFIIVYLRAKGSSINKLPQHLSVPHDFTIRDFYKRLSSSLRCRTNRLRISQAEIGSAFLSPTSKEKLCTVASSATLEKSQKDHGPSRDLTLWVKDLGPQMNWRTVFALEYLGPLTIHPIMAYHMSHSPMQPYQSSPVSSSLLSQFIQNKQALLCIMITAHYLKRELETFFVHHFSQDTMPLSNLYKNCIHYWILGGLNMAYWLYSSPNHPTASSHIPLLPLAGIMIYLVGETWNLATHLVLRNLRTKSNSRERQLPVGWGFDTITCPNYLAETLSWLGVWIFGDFSLATLVFLVFSTVQMLLWARKKEVRYRREFGERYRWKRWSMIPGLS